VQRGMQRRKRRLFAPWALPASGATAPKVSGALDPGVGSVLVVPELSRFHRPGCPAVGGLAARSLDPRDIPTHLEPCDLCEADAIVREERTWTSVAG